MIYTKILYQMFSEGGFIKSKQMTVYNNDVEKFDF
jgi:hypothetical protein